MCALIERWMDTTYTFHLPFGEMTITLFDFTAITGQSFSREPIPLSNKAYSPVIGRNIWLKDQFGVATSVKSSCSSLIQYMQLVDKITSEHDAGRISSEQLALCVLFYHVSVVIFPNASRTDYLQLLPILRNFRDFPKYYWDAAAFSHMYSSLDVACRGVSRICSCLFVLDVSAIFLPLLTALLVLNVLASFFWTDLGL